MVRNPKPPQVFLHDDQVKDRKIVGTPSVRQAETAAVRRYRGPGDFLAEIVKEEYGEEACAGCDATKAKMNQWGWKLCLDRMDDLIKELRQNAHNHSWKLKLANAALVAIGTADQFYRDLITRACERARREEMRKSIRWCIGVTAAKRDVDLLSGTLSSLEAAGWPASAVVVFADGVFDVPAKYSVVRREQPIGALPNFFAMASELLVRNPHADCFLLSQDDVEYVRGIRAYLEDELPLASVIKLFTDQKCEAKLPNERGWHVIPEHLDMRGAQSYLFSQEMLRDFLRSDETIKQRTQAERADNAIDNVVARWARKTPVDQYCHVPSLSQHTGRKHSTIGHDDCHSQTYPGSEFDATQWVTLPSVTAVMITKGKSREKLARMSVRCFRNQTFGDRQLLIARDDGASLFDETFPMEDNERELQAPPGLSLGMLRNWAITQADTDLVIQWDDDDWHHSDRIRLQVAAWDRRDDSCVVLSSQIRCDMNTGEAVVFTRAKGIWGTIMHSRSCQAAYPDEAKGEDVPFMNAFRVISIPSPASTYIRFYHGSNTWDREHIMDVASRELRDTERALLNRVRSDLCTCAKDRWGIHKDRIEGWFSGHLLSVYDQISRLHSEHKIHGDILEVGLHCGRSFIPLHDMLRGDEKLIGIDDFRDRKTKDGKDVRQEFYTNIGLCIPELPEGSLVVLEANSKSVRYEDYLEHTRGCRVIHIDGGHEFKTAMHDLQSTSPLLLPGGILMIDDVFHARYVDVGEAVREFLAESEFVPLGVAFNRMLLCRRDDMLRGDYIAMLEAHPIRTRSVRFMGMDLVRLATE